MLFVRKISDSKWPSDYKNGDAIKADCLGDLKTDNNSLSIWNIKNGNDVEYVASIIVANSNGEPRAITRFVFFSDSDLKRRKIVFNPTDPKNKVTIRTNGPIHYDAQELKVNSVVSIAKLVADKYSSGDIYKISKDKILSILAQSYKKSDFDLESIFSPSLRKMIKKRADELLE